MGLGAEQGQPCRNGLELLSGELVPVADYPAFIRSPCLGYVLPGSGIISS